MENRIENRQDWSIEKPDANEVGQKIAKKWASDRGLNWELLEEKAHIRAVYAGRQYGGAGVAVPMFGVPRQNEIVRICRPINHIRYINPPGKIEALFNYQVLDGNNDPVIITEGITDALTMIQIAPVSVKVVSIPGVVYSSKPEIFEKLAGRIVLTSMDNDKPGYEATKNLFESLAAAGVESVRKLEIPDQYNDINEWFMAAGDNEINIETMLQYAGALHEIEAKKNNQIGKYNEQTPSIIFSR